MKPTPRSGEPTPIRLPTAAEQRELIREFVACNEYVDAELPAHPSPDHKDH